MSRVVPVPPVSDSWEKRFMTYFEECWAFPPYLSELNICILGELFPDTLPYSIFVAYDFYTSSDVFITRFSTFFLLKNGIFKIPASPVEFPDIDVTPPNAKYFWVRIIASTPTVSITIVEKKINICKPSSNGVPIRWLNNLGGWDFFIFDGLIEYKQENNSQTYRKYLARNPKVLISPSKLSVKVSCNEHINDKNIEGIATLFTAREAYWYDLDNRMYRYRPIKSIPFVPVFVEPSSVVISEAGRSGTYEVVFELVISEQNT